jgi:uncharacterized protein (TIGR02145 family)/prepilin-type N-terminal cleavage/methylation domain-containing protein
MKKKNMKKKKAFTLIELLVVIAIIGLIATLAVIALQQARKNARDAKRVADIKQIQTALELYFNDVGHYPHLDNVTSSIRHGESVYMHILPQAPTPADGECSSAENQYVYSHQGDSLGSYSISFCLGSQIGTMNNHLNCATPLGVLNYSCSEEPLDPPPSETYYTLTYTAGENGQLIGSTTQTVLSGIDGSPVEADPDTGYNFLKWSDDINDNPRTDTNVTENITVEAIFSAYEYSLNYSAGTGGSVTGDTSQTVSHGDSGTEVTAVADSGYTFSQWSDGVMTESRTDTNVIGNITAEAEFNINTYTLTYSAGTGGSITGNTSQTVNHGDSGTEVTAVADSGYTFSQWSDGVMTESRTDTNVTENITVIATFEEEVPEECSSVSHSCGNPCMYEGQEYQTVEVGTQCWFADNLNVGTRISILTNQNDTNNVEKYCFNDNESNCDIYGGLYQYNQASNYLPGLGAQGICPAGWYIPTSADITTLTGYLSGNSGYWCNANSNNIAKSLASQNYWLSSTGTCAVGNNQSLNNSSGFNLLPAGYISSGGSNLGLGDYGEFWLSTTSDSAVFYIKYNSATTVNYTSVNSASAVQVRCIKSP